MRSIYRYILFLCIILYTFPQLYAFQESFRSISIPEGMTDLVVNSIYKDKRGFIWFGTNSSLEKFDGIRLKKYNLDVNDNILKRVYTICETSDNELLCGTGDGLHKLDKSSDKFVRVFSDKITFKVNSILPLASDSILLATDKGLYLCIDDTVSQCLFDSNVFSTQNQATGIIATPDSSSVWISTMDGLIYYVPSTDEYDIYRCEDSSLSNSFYNISMIGDYIYLGTMNKGLMRFSIKEHEFSSYVDVGCSVISSLSSDGNDMLYVGTDGNGVHFVSVSEDRIVKSFRHTSGNVEGLRSNSVYSVLVDRDGIIWVGLYQMGVNYTLYQSGLFSVYKWKDLFSSKDMPVRTIAFNGNQRLIGSRDGLVFIDEERDIVRYYNASSLRSNMIISSCFFNGQFYIGTYGGGMYVLNPEDLSITDFLQTSEEPFHNGHIFCIRPDALENLWVGTSDGLYCFNDGKQVYHFTSSHSKLPNGNVYEIFFDSSHKGWICTESGMCIWNPSTKGIITDSFPEGFVNHEKIRAVYETSEKILYFLPEKGPLFRSDISMNEFQYIRNISMLDGKQFLSIIEDDLGGILVTTNNGMYRFDADNNVVPFNLADGIPSPIFINCTSVVDSEGFWFGNSKGLVLLKSGKINKLRKYPYKVEITDIMINGEMAEKQPYKVSDGVYSFDIDESKRNLTVMFSGLVYTDPSNMIYEYNYGNSSEWFTLHGLSEISLYDVTQSSILNIRRAGYPESQITLHINVKRNTVALMYIILLIVILIVLIYLLRGWLKTIIIGNLKKFIIWLQAGDKTTGYKGKTLENIESSVTTDASYNYNDDTMDVDDNYVEHGIIDAEKYKTNRLSEEECKRLLKILDKEMVKNKLYVNPSLKIADLAVVANTSSHALSYLFNQYLRKSYYDYINEFRVEEFKDIIQKEKYSKYTLEALSEHCGFSSRASFFRSFKKATGITPNEYIKNIKGETKEK